MARKSILLIFMAGLFFILSCAEPIDRDLIQVAEDVFPPEVIELSPENNSYYYSTVEVQGTVEDNSLFGGDGEGRLASISFTLSNNLARRGKIHIDRNGGITKDLDSGNCDILYFPDTGIFRFSFSTLGNYEYDSDGDIVLYDIDGNIVPDGTGNPKIIDTDLIKSDMNIFIQFEDANGNIVEEIISLYPFEGPYLDITDMKNNEKNYIPEQIFRIYGNIFNSEYEYENGILSSDEIVFLRWEDLSFSEVYSLEIDTRIIAQEADGHYEVNWDDMGLNSTDQAPIHNPILYYYPEGIVGSSYPGNPELNGYFYSTYYVPDDQVGNIELLFIVKDIRGIKEKDLEQDITIYPKKVSPIFSGLHFDGSGVFEDIINNRFYYSSQMISDGDVICKGNLNVNGGTISQIDYSITTNDNELDPNTVFGMPLADSTFEFIVDFADLRNSPGYSSEIFINADNTLGQTTTSIKLYDDPVNPVITVGANDYRSDNLTNTDYAASGDTIILDFIVTDYGSFSGISGISTIPQVSIAGNTTSEGVTLIETPAGSGLWSATYVMGTNVGDIGFNSSSIPFEISITDNAGNEGTLSDSDISSDITYYEDNNGLLLVSPSYETIPSSSLETPVKWIIPGEDLRMTYSVNRDLETDPIVTIFNDNSVDTTGGPLFTSEYTLSNSDDDNNGAGLSLAFDIQLVDKAGNTKLINSDSGIWFDGTPPDNPTISSDIIGDYLNGEADHDVVEITVGYTNAEAGDEIVLAGLSVDTYSYVFPADQVSGSRVFDVSRSHFVDSSGSTSVYAQHIDVAGNSSDSPLITKLFDIVPPTITSINYDPDRTSFQSSVAVTISATIAGESGDPTISVGSENGTLTDGNDDGIWEYSYTTAGSEGTYAISITAVDVAGNSATESGTSIEVDNTEPSITGITYNPDRTSFQSSTDITISAAISDEMGSPTISIGAEDGVMADTNGDGIWEYLYTTVTSEGTYAISITAVDEAENSETVSGVSIEVDNESPDNPTISSDIIGDYINGEADHDVVEITIGYTNAEAGDEIVLAGLSVDTYSYIFPADQVSGSRVFDVSRSHFVDSSGSTSVYAQHIDVAGNSSDSPSITKLFDIVPPTITSINYDPDRTSFQSSVAVIISATIAGESGDPTISIGSENGTMTDGNDDGIWEYSYTTAGSEGTYAISITAVDVAGNSTTESGSSIIVDNAAPTGFTVSSFSYQSVVLADYNVTFTISGIAESSRMNITYTLLSDGASGPGVTSMSDSTGLITSATSYTFSNIDIIGMRDGNITCSVIINDEAENAPEPEKTSATVIVKPRL